MDSFAVELALALVRGGAGLLVAAWIVWSLKRVHTALSDFQRNWTTWDTYPIPDKRAVRNLSALLLVGGGWMLLTAAIVAYLAWTVGLVP